MIAIVFFFLIVIPALFLANISDFFIVVIPRSLIDGLPYPYFQALSTAFSLVIFLNFLFDHHHRFSLRPLFVTFSPTVILDILIGHRFQFSHCLSSLTFYPIIILGFLSSTHPQLSQTTIISFLINCHPLTFSQHVAFDFLIDCCYRLSHWPPFSTLYHSNLCLCFSKIKF